MEAYENKSPFLQQHYEGDLLWSHIGTSARRPKYFIRSIIQGIPAWNPHIQITFFTSAQIAFGAGIQAIVEAAKPPAQGAGALQPASSALACPDAQAERIKKLEQQLASKDAGPSRSSPSVKLTPGTDIPMPELQAFIGNNKQPVTMGHAFKYPDKDGKWVAIGIDDFCPRCFRTAGEHHEASHAAHEHKCSFKLSPNAPANANDKLHWNLGVVSELVALPLDRRAAAYKAAARQRSQRLKATCRRSNADGRDPTGSGSLSPEEQVEYSAF